jgi:putative protease
VEHVERLVKIGITSLKVEGRTKSAYYAARTAQVYRQAIDDAVAGRPFDESLLGQLQGLANRGYTDGFYQRHHTQEHQNYMRGASETNRSQYVGDVLGIDGGWARVDVKNHFAVGDRIEVMHPGGNRDITISRMLADDGSEITIAPGSGHIVRIQLEEGLDGALLSRYL